MNQPAELLSQDQRAAVAAEAYELLDPRYRDSRPLLNFSNPFELLIGVVLSAQTTDRQVNEVTPALFAAYPDAKALSGAPVKRVEELVRSSGFFRRKAASIIGAASRLIEAYGGEVPGTMEELLTIPGVGRKSANVILGHVFGKEAIIVDTHFMRVTGRLGLISTQNPDKIEREIAEIVPPARQTRFSMIVNYHGRDICFARKPDCAVCPVQAVCLYYGELTAGTHAGP